jgi:hypothetical protein
MRVVTFVSILLANIAILIASSYRNRNRREHDSELVLNQGRPKLNGNIGFWLIESNVQGLMRTPTTTTQVGAKPFPAAASLRGWRRRAVFRKIAQFDLDSADW